MYSKKRSYGAGVSGLSAMSTGALMKKARSYEAAKTARNRAPRIKGAIAPYGGRQELKYVDIASAPYAADTTGTVTALNLLAIGDDNTSRDGRQVCIKSVQVRGSVVPIDTSTQPTMVRLLLVWDNAVNGGAIATVANILSAATSNSFPLVDNANRFTILSDQQFVVGGFQTTATQAYAGSPMILPVNIYKKMNNVTQYIGTTATIGAIQNGGLLMVTIGDQAAAAGAAFVLATRVRFTDS